MESSSYPFVDFKVVQTYRPLERALQWRLDSAFRDVGPFKFVVEASETPSFGKLLYKLPVTSGFYSVDDGKQPQSTIIDLYYRVRLLTGTDHIYCSAPVYFQSHGEKRSLYLRAKEIIRKEFVRFRYTGQKGWVLKRKNYGEQNPENLDPITGVPLTDNSSDLGTGYEGGYYDPLLVTYSREGIENSSQLNEQGFGTTAQESQKHRYVGFPILEPYDVLITDTNQRYRYTKVNSTYMPGTDLVLIQMCDALLLPPTDPIYSIPLAP